MFVFIKGILVNVVSCPGLDTWEMGGGEDIIRKLVKSEC